MFHTVYEISPHNASPNQNLNTYLCGYHLTARHKVVPQQRLHIFQRWHSNHAGLIHGIKAESTYKSTGDLQWHNTSVGSKLIRGRHTQYQELTFAYNIRKVRWKKFLSEEFHTLYSSPNIITASKSMMR
jgi:hypothetical protein